jgi:integrase
MPPGIYRTATGWRVIACIGRGKGKRAEKAFPAIDPDTGRPTALRTMTRWQADTCTELRRAPRAAPGSLQADLEVYLPIKEATMPKGGYRERTRLMGLWLAQLGPRRNRADIQPVEIRAALAQWEVNGCPGGKGPWDKGSSNRARTALMDFYNVLGGKSGYNPVRDVKRHREFRKPAPKIDYPTLDAILDAMPDYGQGIKGQTRREVSQTKARLCVIAYTGWPHAQIMRLKPEHIDWAGRQVYIEGRRKGEGTEDRWLPVSDAGMLALRLFADAKAFGSFSPSAMRMSFKRAMAKLGVTNLTPYKLRHLFGTAVLRSSGNRAAASWLMVHASEDTIKWYTQAAEHELMRSALDAYDRDVVGPRCGPRPKAAGEVAVSDSE